MFRVLQKFSNRKIASVVLLSALFALTFAGSLAGSAQNRNQSKSKAAAQTKKNAKATPTPNKKAQAKAAPTSKKADNKKDKKNSAASKASERRAESKNKKDDKAKQSASKSARSNERDSSADRRKKDAKQTRDAKQKTDSGRNARNSKADDSKNKSSASKSSSRTAKTGDRASNAAAVNRRTATAAVKTESKTNAPANKTATTTKTKSSPPSESVAENQSELPQIIVTDFAARVRRQAKPDAPEMSRLKLGTVLKVTEKNPAWYRVKYVSEGKDADGWISANSVNDLNAAAREDLYRQIVERNFKNEMDFAAAAEMVDFLTGVSGELGNTNSAAELELKRLLALRAALKKIPAERRDQAPYKEFLRAHEKSVVYSEPSGEWLVASNRFWDLHKKYAAATPIADRVAWEAAQNSLPGECEGYVNCYLFAERMTNGEYLRLHPTGAKSVEALTNLIGSLDPIVADLNQKSVYNGPTDVTDRAEFNNLIAELRTIVSRLPLTDKEKALRHLKQIAEAYR